MPMPPAIPYWSAQEPLSQADLLALLDRILPAWYLEPLKSPGPGYEYLQAVALMNARVSEAVAHIGTGCFIGSGTGGAYATAQVELFRESAIYGAVTLLKGTQVATADGYYYQTMADVVFVASDLGPHSVQVQALARGWQWNKAGPITRQPSGEVLPGWIDRLVGPVVTGTNFDPTIQVRQLTNATGGVSAMLDGVGQDRGIYRNIVPASVVLTRSNTWPVNILTGSRFATADGYLYRTIEPVQFKSGDTAPKTVRLVPLLQEAQTVIDGHGLITSAEIVRWGGTTPDPTLAVSSPTRYFKESDESYRTRIAFLPETVTPSAIRRLVDQILGPTLQPASLTWNMREVWDIRYQTAYDFPMNETFNTAEINVSVPEYSSNIFVYDYDDALGNEDPLSNRYLSGTQGQIVFALPDLGTDNAVLYPALAANLEQSKPAGTDLAYILVP